MDEQGYGPCGWWKGDIGSRFSESRGQKVPSLGVSRGDVEALIRPHASATGVSSGQLIGLRDRARKVCRLQ